MACRRRPALPLESSSNTWPRRFMLSRPMRVPSAATQLQESPCLPPVDWMTKCRAIGRRLRQLRGRDLSQRGPNRNHQPDRALLRIDDSV